MSKTTPANPAKTDPLYNHYRLKLSGFINDLSFFANNKDEQTKADGVYRKMLTKEKELMKGKIPMHTQEMPEKFDLPAFTAKVTKDNTLTTALKQHFGKGVTNKAAWEYITLKGSIDELEKTKTPESKGSNGDPNKPPAAKQNQGQGEGATSGEAQGRNDESEMDIDNKDDMFGYGYEDEMEDLRNSVISSLIWMNHDYFDSKISNKAQAENKYYKMLEREWKQQKKGEVQNGTIDQFKALPKNRPIHAVITTILEQARKTEHAKAAAGEYVKLRTMEKSLATKPIPKDIDLDERDPNCSLKKMAERYRMPSSRSFRQAAEFKMVPLEEYKQLRGTIEHQRNQISELSSRLSGITSQQIADGEIFTEIGDQNKPRRLGQRFSEVFEDTWSNAYEVLKPKKPESKKEDEKEEMDEKTIEILQTVVKVIYEFCKKTADSQVNKLMMGMTPPIFDPMNTKKETKGDDDTVAKTEKMAKDYRKAVAPATIPILKQNILTQELQGKVLKDISIGKELKEYVDNCVNLIWYMCIQQPPMEIVWGNRGEKFNKEMFRFSGKKGTKFRLTVWPAVLYFKDGGLAAPGYAVPE
ncbi:Hypothetical predicted protein [Mytilus galloprovincialis]|uniref:Mitochondria-eating protein C-terminal domain-containing protein n=1 Tax=Mytilus galloprovincialis TaxID=29158 RepID=A0A8B6BW48_MYTGA|nr:Hypothetical predicted protein [Mytilus galloprovincialis]